MPACFKADTVRVLALLRSQYASEDDRDDKLIESEMQLDIVEHRNSIIWRPYLTNTRVPEGKLSIWYSLIHANHSADASPDAPDTPKPPEPLPDTPTPSTTPSIASTPCLSATTIS